jgi:DNA repair ATPase RecN|tara:strand:- start:9256 stop:9699 length:444 start_codon:yes stop_codon:yes gene_type:complete
MSTLDVKKNIRHEFNSPKKLYSIEFYNDRYPTIQQINCYGVYKRQKDILIRRKRELRSVGSKKVKYQKIWERFKPQLISDDLSFAKKMAVIEFKKFRLEKINKRINTSKENIEKYEKELESLETNPVHINDVKFNDSNRDITSISLF